MIKKNAYAKINLSLEVLGKRKDGYHDIVSVMQLVDLHDTLTFEPADDLVVVSDHPTLAAEADGNLVWRAAHALRQAHGVSSGARIHLQKRIPLSAGLGGGSSDAAATLRGLSDLWRLDLSTPELREVGATLGSDVPFFLGGPTALVEGRGERVSPIPPPPQAWVVLVCQHYDVPNKTAHLYDNLHRKDHADGNTTRRLISALLQGEFPSSSLLCNSFERSAYEVFDGLDSVRQKIMRAGGREVHLSGSGPTLYVLFPGSHQSRARDLYDKLHSEGLRAFLVRTLTREAK